MIESDFIAYINEDKSFFDTAYRNFFEVFGPYCKEIHMSDRKGHGVLIPHHGIAFDRYEFDSAARFDWTLSYIDRYMPNAELCIEVSEKDYIKAENFSKMMELIKEYDNHYQQIKDKKERSGSRS